MSMVYLKEPSFKEAVKAEIEVSCKMQILASWEGLCGGGRR